MDKPRDSPIRKMPVAIVLNPFICVLLIVLEESFSLGFNIRLLILEAVEADGSINPPTIRKHAPPKNASSVKINRNERPSGKE